MDLPVTSAIAQPPEPSGKTYPFSPEAYQIPLEGGILGQEFSHSIEGILVFDEQARPIYMNEIACSIMSQWARKNGLTIGLPEEIHYICRSMIESRRVFPGQTWLLDLKVFVDYLTAFQIEARWVKNNTAIEDYLLLRMEDQNQFLKDIALEEARLYGLTSREQEVWLLHRANYTYKQIAQELDITPNTVKKHMKSILTKQKICHPTQGTNNLANNLTD